MKAEGVSGNMLRKSMKSVVRPKTHSPTTSRPQTAPPRRAVSMDDWYERVAAAAVRTLARTEIHMPMYPASPDMNAPAQKVELIRQAIVNVDMVAWGGGRVR